MIDGRCDPAFEPVRRAFIENFEQRAELGAAVCVHVAGKPVVDLWGGHADCARTKAWQRDTLCAFYSVGKALTALCALQLVDRGLVALDAPVCRLWPELAAHGKAAITLRDVLTHRAGLPAIRKRMPEGSMLDWQAMCEAIADTEPWWPPGTQHGYHVNTFGYLAGEVVRRATGESLGQYLRRHVTEPLGADLAIGVPEADLARVAELDWPRAREPQPSIDLDAAMSDDERMMAHAYGNPSGISSLGVLNTEAWRRAEVPSTNGHGTARGLSRVCAALANDGALDGVRVLSPQALGEAIKAQAVGVDRVLKQDMRWGLGFQLTHDNRPLGPNPRSFGHFGNGGSLAFADPDAKVGFGYVMNRIVRNWKSPQNRALIDALYRCV